MNFANGRWTFTNDEDRFRRAKSKRGSSVQFVGLIHNEEVAAFNGTKHVFTVDEFMFFIEHIDHCKSVHGQLMALQQVPF